MSQPRLFDRLEAAGEPRVVLERDGLVTYEPRFLDPASADLAFDAVLGETAWAQDHLTIAGRRIPFPRLTAWYGDPGAAYTYSGVRNEPRPWIDVLETLRRRVSARVGVRFTSVLLNQYRGGDDGMGWHADDEPELGPQPIIASLSLGAERTFQLKHRDDAELLALALEHGSLLVMAGATQHRWLHRVPKQKSARGVRLNLTFRCL